MVRLRFYHKVYTNTWLGILHYNTYLCRRFTGTSRGSIQESRYFSFSIPGIWKPRALSINLYEHMWNYYIGYTCALLSLEFDTCNKGFRRSLYLKADTSTLAPSILWATSPPLLNVGFMPASRACITFCLGPAIWRTCMLLLKKKGVRRHHFTYVFRSSWYRLHARAFCRSILSYQP
jgi:hypothetical protein